jgi:hypothetical protein
LIDVELAAACVATESIFALAAACANNATGDASKPNKTSTALLLNPFTVFLQRDG